MGTRTRYTLILLLLFYALTGWAQDIRVTSLTATTAITNNGSFVTPAGAGNLKIWTSDANGVGSWQVAGSAVDTNALARLNGLGTNAQINGFTVTAGGFTNLVATTNAGPVNNAAAVTNYSTVQNKGGVTNASWTATLGPVTNFGGVFQLGGATVQVGGFTNYGVTYLSRGSVSVPSLTFSNLIGANLGSGLSAGAVNDRYVFSFRSNAVATVLNGQFFVNTNLLLNDHVTFSSSNRIQVGTTGLPATNIYSGKFALPQGVLEFTFERPDTLASNIVVLPPTNGPSATATNLTGAYLGDGRIQLIWTPGGGAGAGDITGGNANQFTESAGILTLMNGLLITNAQSRGFTNLSGPVLFASGADSFIVNDDAAFNSTIDANSGINVFSTSAARIDAPLVINGSFNLTPITNSTTVISQSTNAFVRRILTGHTTFTFGGTPLNGASGKVELDNPFGTNITVTWPLSYSTPQAAGITTFTAYSNSITKVIWETVGGSNRVTVAGKEIVENFLNPTAGQIIAFHDPWTKTNVNDQVGAGGALIRVQTNTVTVASVTNINLIVTNGHGLGRLATNNAATGSVDLHLFLENAGIPSSKLQATTGTGGPVLSNAPTINTPTLTVPVIADFSSAQHTHQSAAQGGALDAAAIASGTIATARLGSGTANSSTFLRGDQTYATPAGGGDATLAGAQTFTGPKTFSAAMTNTANHWILGAEGIGLFVGDESGATNFFGAQAFGPVVGQALNLTMGGTDWLLFNGSTDTIIPGVSNNITAGSPTKSLSNIFSGRMTFPTSASVPVPPSGHVSLINTNNAVHALKNDGTLVNLELGGAGGGDVVGPASANDLAIAVFDSTTGKLIKQSGVTLSDTTMTGLSVLSATTLNGNTINSGTMGNFNALTVTNFYDYLWIPAGALTPANVNGATTNTYTVAGADGTTIDVFDFDDTTPETNFFTWTPPEDWDRGTFKVKPTWTSVTGTGTVAFGFRFGAISNDDPFGAILGTQQLSTDTLIASNDRHEGPATAAITAGGTPALGDMLLGQVVRETGSDTKTGDAKLIGIMIQYKRTLNSVAW